MLPYIYYKFLTNVQHQPVSCNPVVTKEEKVYSMIKMIRPCFRSLCSGHDAMITICARKHYPIDTRTHTPAYGLWLLLNVQERSQCPAVRALQQRMYHCLFTYFERKMVWALDQYSEKPFMVSNSYARALDSYNDKTSLMTASTQMHCNHPVGQLVKVTSLWDTWSSLGTLSVVCVDFCMFFYEHWPLSLQHLVSLFMTNPSGFSDVSMTTCGEHS